jgi:DNA end-binding protein Ku
LAPADPQAQESYALIREGIRAKKVAALAQIVLFRRVRTVLIRSHGQGLIATTLNFDYEVRSSKEAFDDIPDMKIKGEMLELAEHIIKTKKGRFDPSKYTDRYESALAELVKAKLEGKKIEARMEPKRDNVVDLMAALRESASLKAQKPVSHATAKTKPAGGKENAAPAQRKAGLTHGHS